MTPITQTTRARSDADIFVDARRELDQRRTVPGTVRVHVDHGTVTLTGSVQLAFERSEAEDAVRQIDGVQRVVNDIVVGRAPSAEGFEPPDEVA